ncbi:MAG: CopG family ribbon-helix-helix protein [Tagaea sp.]
MPSDTIPITIRADKALVEKLDKIAKSLDRSRNWVATRALADYAALTTHQLERIEAGIADARAGRLVDAEAFHAGLREKYGWES